MAASEQKTADHQPKTELDDARWAVISFDQCEASSLTYPQAAEKLAELRSRNIAGLCVVTDDAAMRLSR